MAAKASESPSEHVEVLKKHLQAFEAAGPTKGHEYVRQCRVKNCKEKEKSLLTYSLSTLQDTKDVQILDLAIHHVLNSVGAEIKAGTPPPTDAERKLQKEIDSVRASLGLTQKS